MQGTNSVTHSTSDGVFVAYGMVVNLAPNLCFQEGFLSNFWHHLSKVNFSKKILKLRFVGKKKD